MSEDQAPVAESESPAEPIAKVEAGDMSPEAVHDAVKAAIASDQEQAAGLVQLGQCPCGAANMNLMLEIPQGAKVGRATCGTCGVWGVDFLAPRTQDQNVVSVAAAKAWNEAPRE